MSDKPNSTLSELINPADLAKHLKISRQAVQQWLANGVIPAKRVLKVEQITGISRKILNPDIYPD